MSTANSAGAAWKFARQNEGQVMMILGMPRIVKVASDQNATATSVMELVIAPGQGVPPHTHTREDEFFLIMQGELTCQMQGSASPVTVKQGDLLFLPRKPDAWIRQCLGKGSADDGNRDARNRVGPDVRRD